MRGWVYWSISGTHRFISRMAKATPSGKPPQVRMTMVRKPAPRPKISLPRGVVAPDTGSVAMKKAPSITDGGEQVEPRRAEAAGVDRNAGSRR